jgi:hypothetical protein
MKENISLHPLRKWSSSRWEDYLMECKSILEGFDDGIGPITLGITEFLDSVHHIVF